VLVFVQSVDNFFLGNLVSTDGINIVYFTAEWCWSSG